MGKDTKNSSELTKKLSESQTIIFLPGREFILNEMSIGRVRDFGIKIVSAFDKIQSLAKKDITQMEVSAVLVEFGDVVFEEIAEIMNWTFSYKNEDYDPIDAKFIEDNVSIRTLSGILKAVAEQNSLGWLLPFFQDRFQIALKQIE